jgi:hypothetical protein
MWRNSLKETTPDLLAFQFPTRQSVSKQVSSMPCAGKVDCPSLDEHLDGYTITEYVIAHALIREA